MAGSGRTVEAGTERDAISTAVANAVLGIDTLWGGDVMNPSGLGRFIADSWFSDEPLPRAYTHPTAAKVREAGGVSAKEPDRTAIDEYLAAVDVRRRDRAGSPRRRSGSGGLRGRLPRGAGPLLRGHVGPRAWSCSGRGEPVPYERCVVASTGQRAGAVRPDARSASGSRELLVEGRLSVDDGRRAARRGRRLAARAAWFRRSRSRRSATPSSPSSTRSPRGTSFRTFRRRSHAVPRANIEFLPIKDAWFSGSMNYLGRARRPDGARSTRRRYEINASLQISIPEFAAARQPRGRARARHDLRVPAEPLRRAAARFEGDGPHDEHPRRGPLGGDRQQRDPDRPRRHARSRSCPTTTSDRRAPRAPPGRREEPVLRTSPGRRGARRRTSRRVCGATSSCSEERADKLSGAWGRHPLLGPHVPARVPRRDGARRAPPSRARPRDRSPGPLRLRGARRRRDDRAGDRGGSPPEAERASAVGHETSGSDGTDQGAGEGGETEGDHENRQGTSPEPEAAGRGGR